MMLNSGSYAAFARALLAWFSENARDLPWRRGYNPYHIWVAEVALQQTQMERGAPFLERFLARFPDVASLAAASEREVGVAFEGMGYYARARNLRRAAALIMERFDGKLPRDAAALRTLPGIGDYTAAAIASIGFNAPVVAVDANVERVFSRLLDIDIPVKNPKARAYVAEVALACQPEGEARAYNEALMELGALICGRRPKCALCPVASFCEARRLGVENERPVKGKKPGLVRVELVTGVLWHEGRVLLQKRPPVGAWASLWEFPGGSVESGEEEAAALEREFAEEVELAVVPEEKIADIRFAYTRFRALMHAWQVRMRDGGAPAPRLHAAVEFAWVAPCELDAYALPSGMRRLAKLIQERAKGGETPEEEGA